MFDELRRASAGGPADYSGVTYDRLRAGEALHWPVPGTRHPGTPRMFLDAFAHPDGRARFVPVDHSGPAEPPDAEFPAAGHHRPGAQHYQSGAQTRLVPALVDAVPEVFVEVHPDTARRAGLADGDLASVTSRRGSVRARVRCVASLRPDVVFLPFHFPGGGNAFTNPALDPTSRMPEFKVCAVRLGGIVTRRVVVIGYGMAGARLAEELRRRDPVGARVAVTVLGARSTSRLQPGVAVRRGRWLADARRRCGCTTPTGPPATAWICGWVPR